MSLRWRHCGGMSPTDVPEGALMVNWARATSRDGSLWSPELRRWSHEMVSLYSVTSSNTTWLLARMVEGLRVLAPSDHRLDIWWCSSSGPNPVYTVRMIWLPPGMVVELPAIDRAPAWAIRMTLPEPAVERTVYEHLLGE